jgi:hypothetical protein
VTSHHPVVLMQALPLQHRSKAFPTGVRVQAMKEGQARLEAQRVLFFPEADRAHQAEAQLRSLTECRFVLGRRGHGNEAGAEANTQPQAAHPPAIATAVPVLCSPGNS